MALVDMVFRLRIRDASNTSDALVVTSVRGGTNPWLSSIPEGDGQEFDPLSGKSRCGAFTGQIADGITSGTDRIVTSQLEDATFRQQLMDRRAFSEYSTNGGASWNVLVAGFLTSLRTSGADYEYTVSDPTRQEHDYTAFKPSATDTIATFLARWPNRGCIFGGPVRGGFLDQPDLGGWEMTVEKSLDTFLRFNAGYAAPGFIRSTNAEECMAAANHKVDPLRRYDWQPHNSLSSLQDADDGPWPGVVIELVGTGYFQPNPGANYDADVIHRMPEVDQRHFLTDIRFRGCYLTGTSATPAAGTKVRVRAFTVLPTEISPIYLSAHPADILATLWTEAGLDYDASAITAVKQAVGTNRLVSFEITEPKPLGAWLEKNIYGPFGIGVRTNDAGQLEAFSARIPYATAPTTEITAADIATDESGSSTELFAIDQSTAVKKVVFEHQRLIKAQNAGDADATTGYVVQSERFERTNADAGAVGNREISFAVEGMVHSLDSNNPNTAPLVDALALEIFDRWGRGLITGEIQGLRGGSTDTLKLGMEAINKHPALPNHNKRLIDDNSVSGRAMQIVRQTWTPTGPMLKLADSGPNAQPFATVPTLSIGASSAFPRTVAQVTVTNAATLNAAGAGLRLQMAVTTGATPAATDYTDVAAYAAGNIPTGAIVLPTVVAGRKVWARAVATKAGSRPSSWSTVVSVTLTGITAPSSLSVTPSGTDGSTATMTWTVGDSSMLVDVYRRASGAPSSDAVLQRTLPETSNRFVLEGLTPGAAYTVGVRHRDGVTGDVSSTTEVTFTAGATTTTLPAPAYPAGFCGELDPETGSPRRDGVFGLAVIAADYPGYVEVAVAVETSVGSGTYGSFVTDGHPVPSVLGGWTKWQGVAPNDGLRRQIKARHVRDGATSSGYTSTMTVAPWTPQGLPGYPTDVICQVTVLAPSPSADAGVNLRFQVTGIDPAGSTPQVELVSLGTGVLLAAGAAIGTPTANNSVWKVQLPTPGSGPSSVVVRALVGDRYQDQALFCPEQTTLATGQGEISIETIAGNSSKQASASFKADGPGNAGSCRYAFSTSSQPSDSTTAASGTIVNGRSWTVANFATLNMGDAIYVTIIPFTGSSGSGTQLPSIHLKSMYFTYGATKTVKYGNSGWKRTYANGFGSSDPNPTYNSGSGPVNPAIPTSALEYLDMNVLVAAGCQLYSAEFTGIWNSAGTPMSIYNVAVYANNTLQNFTGMTYPGGFQTKTLSLALVAIDGVNPVIFRTQWNGPVFVGPDADAAQAAAGEVLLTYVMTTPEKNI